MTIDRLSKLIGFCILIIGCIGFISGCNNKPKLAPVSGQVKIDGTPLEHGTVTVWVKGYRPAVGNIDKSGRFALETYGTGVGCLPGEYAVTVSSVIMKRNPDSMHYFIPERYEDPKRSGLTVKVDVPRDNWNIDLTWKGDEHKAPYIVK
jgi:hypothetical protein